MRTRTVLLTAVSVVAIAAAAAPAAPDRTVAVDAAAPEFKWDGVQGEYTYISTLPPVTPEYAPENCTKDPDTYCEQYLVEIRSGVPVTVDATLTEMADDADFDLYIYQSDSSGAPGEPVDGGSWSPTDPGGGGTGGPFGQDEIFKAEEVEPGYYLVVVSHYYNPNTTYKGSFKVTGATPVPGAPPASAPPSPPPSGGNTTPAPPPSTGATSLPLKFPATLGSAKKAKKRKSLSFKATATDDISNLSVALIDSRKKVVGKAKLASFPKGSKTIKLKVKRLKAGKYTLAAEGFVDGAKQTIAKRVRIKK